MRKKFRIAALTGSLLLVTAMPTLAQEQSAPPQSAPLSALEETIVHALKQAMSLLSATMETVVPYDLPEVLPNGDIIIRRKQIDESGEPQGKAGDDAVRL